MSFRELQKQCKDLGIKPYSGKGVNKALLQSNLTAYKEEKEKASFIFTSTWEERICSHDLAFYKSIRSIVPQIPDFRPKETLKKMALLNEEGNPIIEPQRNWRLVAEELEALSRQTSEGEEDRQIFDALNNGDEKRLAPFMKPFILERFTLTYPALVYICFKISSEITIRSFLFEAKKWDLVPVPPRFNVMKCIKYGYIEHVRLYLTRKNNSFNVLLMAVQSGSLRIVEMMLKEYSVQPNLDMLNISIRKGCIDITSSLLPYFDLLQNDVYFTIHHGFIAAAEKGHISILSWLMKIDTLDLSAAITIAAAIAAGNKNFNMLKIFLHDSRMNPFEEGYGVFNTAIYAGQVSLVKELLDNECLNSNAVYEGILMAIKHNQADILKILLHHPLFTIDHENKEKVYLRYSDYKRRVEYTNETKSLILKVVETRNKNLIAIVLRHPKITPYLIKWNNQGFQ